MLKFDTDARVFSEIRDENIDLSKEGFILRHHVRTISIYYVINESVVYFSGEISGVPQYDLLIFGRLRHIKKRYYPTKKLVKKIPRHDRQIIQDELITWLNKKHIKHDLILGK